MAQYSYVSTPQHRSLLYKSVIDVFHEKADQFPNKEICIHCLPDGSRQAVTYADLRAKAEKVAKLIVSTGVKTGDSVGILGPNSIAWIVGEVAILIAGGVSVHLAKPGSLKEMYSFLQSASCKAVLLDTDGDDSLMNEIKGTMDVCANPSKISQMSFEDSKAPCIVLLKKWTGMNIPDIETIGNEKEGTQGLIPTRIHPEKTAIVFMTSGSTGHPKMVEHTHFGLVNTSSSRIFSRGQDICDNSGAMYNDRPFTWIGGTVVYNLIHGDTRVFRDGRITLKESGVLGLWDNIVKEKCTNALLMPFTILDLLANEQEILRSNYCLKTIVTGGQIIGSHMADVCGKFCNTLIAGYGSTELSVVAFIEVKDNMELGALGSLSDGMEVKNVDEDWNTVHREELGEICIRCPWMLKGYRTVPGTDRVTLTDGWMNTGDIGFIRSDDSLFIKGKLENVIKRMTLKILSGDVEECIAEIPEVKAAVVVAVPDQRVYEDVCACVVLDQSTGVTMADVELHCRKRLGDTITGDAPTYYLRFEAIPRLNSGKPDRMKVKQHALEMLDIS